MKDNSKIASSLYDKENEIRFRGLVSDPYSIYIEKRLRSVPKFAPQSKLEEQWKINYIDIKKLRDTFPKNSTWRLRFHEQPLLFRFIQTDYNVYIGYYAKEPSSKSPMLAGDDHIDEKVYIESTRILKEKFGVDTIYVKRNDMSSSKLRKCAYDIYKINEKLYD